MAYYTESIPEEHKQFYSYKKRTMNSYNVLNADKWWEIADKYRDNSYVYTCGKSPAEYACRRCGFCLQSYFETKLRIAEANNENS